MSDEKKEETAASNAITNIIILRNVFSFLGAGEVGEMNYSKKNLFSSSSSPSASSFDQILKKEVIPLAHVCTCWTETLTFHNCEFFWRNVAIEFQRHPQQSKMVMEQMLRGINETKCKDSLSWVFDLMGHCGKLNVDFPFDPKNKLSPLVLPSSSSSSSSVLQISQEEEQQQQQKKQQQPSFISIEVKLWSPISFAIHHKLAKSVLAVCQAGADLNRALFLALMAQESDENLEIAELLLCAGAEKTIDETNKKFSHNTPLHCAVTSGNVRAVKLLLKHGANTNVKNPLSKQTAPELARTLGNSEQVVQALLQNSFQRED